MLKKLNRIAQSTAEYAIIIAIVVGAIVAMQVFVKRGIQGRIRDTVARTAQDPTLVGVTGVTDNPFTGNQYEPYYSESNMDAQSSAQRTETMAAGGAVNKVITGEVSTRTGTQVTRNAESGN